MENSNLELLRKKIIQRVLVTHKDFFIYSSQGGGDAWMFDFRKIIMQPEILNAYAELFFERFKDNYPFQVGGIEVASIPLISAIVMKSVERGIPVNGFFIRKSRKKSGLLNMVEGTINNNPIILVDDLMNSGGSFVRQVEVLEQLKISTPPKKINILAIFSILQFKRNEQYSYFTNRKIVIEKLFSLDDFKASIPELTPPNNIFKIRVENKFETIWCWRGNNPSFEYVNSKPNPLIYKSKLYFSTDDGQFVCLEAVSGKLIWDYHTPFGRKRRIQFSNPIIYNNLIIFANYDGNIYAFNAETGKRDWVNFEGDWIGSSPAIATKLKLIFIPLEFGVFNKYGSLVAISAETGEKKWEFRPLEKSTLSTPSYSSILSLVFCGSLDGIIRAFDAKTGKIVWENNLNCKIVNAPGVDEENGLLIINGSQKNSATDEKGNLTVLDINTGKIKYVYEEFYYGSFGTPIIYKNNLIFTSLDKHIYSIDIKTGEKLWTVDSGARIFSAPAIYKIDGKNRLYVGSNNSVLQEIDPETGTVTSMSYVTERITNKVVFDEESKILFLSTYANEVYALKRNPGD